MSKTDRKTRSEVGKMGFEVGKTSWEVGNMCFDAGKTAAN